MKIRCELLDKTIDDIKADTVKHLTETNTVTTVAEVLLPEIIDKYVEEVLIPIDINLIVDLVMERLVALYDI